MCVHALFTKQTVAVSGVACGVGIRVAELHNPLNDFLPGNCLDVNLLVRIIGMAWHVLDFQEVVIEVSEFSKSLDVDDVLNKFDHPEESKGPEHERASP